jgi:uncharacterized protein YqgC (DUF456 family)
MSVVATILLFLVLLFGVVSILFGLPGTTILFLAALVWGIATGFREVTAGMLVGLGLLTLLGEGADYALGVIGARRFGSSGKGIVFSLVGGFFGALAGAPFLFGAGAVLGALVGAFLGAMGAELLTYGPGQWKKAVRSGWGNFLGRVAGMVVKMAIAVGMAVWTLSRVL